MTIAEDVVLLLLMHNDCSQKFYVWFIFFRLCPSDPSASADLAVVMMQEGLAQIFLIGKRYILSVNLPLHMC